MAELKGQVCPICNKKSLTLREEEMDIPHFGEIFIFSMTCDECHYKKADVEPAKEGEPAKYTLDVDSDKDMNIKIVKAGDATVKIPYIITIEPGPAGEGYITNVEGLLNKVKAAIESAGEAEEDAADKKKARKLIKKINKIILGREKTKIIIEDPSGHSAILSDKVKKGKL
ncbi:ZPR1 zinc finger domain-containing protein [Nanoarchaeota archaeon]